MYVLAPQPNLRTMALALISRIADLKPERASELVQYKID